MGAGEADPPTVVQIDGAQSGGALASVPKDTVETGARPELFGSSYRPFRVEKVSPSVELVVAAVAVAVAVA